MVWKMKVVGTTYGTHVSQRQARISTVSCKGNERYYNFALNKVEKERNYDADF